jgi:manganese/zinc/iron transport system substrate-binding protein
MIRPLTFTCLLLSICIPACSKAPTETAEALGVVPTRVVTTTGMIADLVRAIGGDRVKVTNLIGEGVDPHLYKPTRDDVAALLDADIIFYNGLHLEGRMGDVLKRAGADRPTIAVTERIPEELLIHPGEEQTHADPHVWLAPSVWMLCGNTVFNALAEMRPTDRAAFQVNLETVRKSAEDLDALGTSAIGSIPPEKRLLITSHDAFNYFGRAFDIEVVGVQGISTDSEAGLADLEALVDLVVERGVPAVFVESSVPRRSIEALVEGTAARGHIITIGGELFSDSMGPSGTPEGTWRGMVHHNIRVVTEALGGTFPAPSEPENPETVE